MKIFWMLCLFMLLSCTETKVKLSTYNYIAVSECAKMWVDVYYPNIDALIKMCKETNAESSL